MTTVTALDEGDTVTLTARGHSSDVEACNYITGALYSFAHYAANEASLLEFRTKKEAGELHVKARGGEALKGAFESALYGLLALQEQHPEAVQVLLD